MKKVILSVATVVVSMTASAQVYVGINVGYGVGTPGEKLGTTSTVTASGKTDENIYGTFGGGLNLGITPGFWFGEHVGAEIGLNYFMGSEIEAQKTTTPFGEATARAHSSQFRLQPSLIVRTGGEKVDMYAKAGIVIPAGGKTTTEFEDSGAGGPNTASSATYETKGAFSLGYTGAIGFDLNFGEHLSFFGELQAISLRINAKERSTTAATSNGTDVLSNMTTYQKEVTYVDELNPSSNNSGYNANFSSGSAREELRTRNNFGGVFLNVGLKYNF